MGIVSRIKETQEAAQNINVSGETLKQDGLRLISNAKETMIGNKSLKDQLKRFVSSGTETVGQIPATALKNLALLLSLQPGKVIGNTIDGAKKFTKAALDTAGSPSRIGIAAVAETGRLGVKTAKGAKDLGMNIAKSPLTIWRKGNQMFESAYDKVASLGTGTASASDNAKPATDTPSAAPMAEAA